MEESAGATPPMERFECTGCGRCCRDFGKDGFLPLWEWEVEEYRKLAGEKGLELRIEPEGVIHDRKSGLLFCLKYGMHNQPCPFLNESKCSIYGKRSLACRAFPVAKTPFETHKIGKENFLTCPALDAGRLFQAAGAAKGKGARIKSQETDRIFRGIFGDSYDCCDQNEMITSVVKRTFRSLVHQGRVQPEEAQLPRGKRAPVYPFFEFLARIGACTGEERIETVNMLKDHELFLRMMKERGSVRASKE